MIYILSLVILILAFWCLRMEKRINKSVNEFWDNDNKLMDICLELQIKSLIKEDKPKKIKNPKLIYKHPKMKRVAKRK